MSEVNDNAMSDAEAEQYFAMHRRNQMALQAFLDEIKQHPREVTATAGDPDFDAEVQAAYRQTKEALSKIQQAQTLREPTDER